MRAPGVIWVRDVEGRTLLRTRCQYIRLSQIDPLRLLPHRASIIVPRDGLRLSGYPLTDAGAEDGDKRNALYPQQVTAKF